jgi:hypothetical protein
MLFILKQAIPLRLSIVIRTIKVYDLIIQVSSRCTRSNTENPRRSGSGSHIWPGTLISLEHPEATNNDFNMSTVVINTVIELAEAMWKKIYGDSKPFNYMLERKFEYDI